MSQHEETCLGVAPRQASELHSAGKLEFSEVSPGQDQKQEELPRVAEARARDAVARTKLRGLIPRTMLHLENGRAWQKAEALRTAVFGAPNDGSEP